jgi:hypothetical protein
MFQSHHTYFVLATTLPIRPGPSSGPLMDCICGLFSTDLRQMYPHDHVGPVRLLRSVQQPVVSNNNLSISGIRISTFVWLNNIFGICSWKTKKKAIFVSNAIVFIMDEQCEFSNNETGEKYTASLSAIDLGYRQTDEKKYIYKFLYKL